jgi:hypothetical protein
MALLQKMAKEIGDIAIEPGLLQSILVILQMPQDGQNNIGQAQTILQVGKTFRCFCLFPILYLNSLLALLRAFGLCSGYHVPFTRERSWVQSTFRICFGKHSLDPPKCPSQNLTQESQGLR